VTSDSSAGCAPRRGQARGAGVFGKDAQSLVRQWVLISGGRLYGAKISVEYYLYLFPSGLRKTRFFFQKKTTHLFFFGFKKKRFFGFFKKKQYLFLF